jgi:hypothetical protein
MTVNGTNFFFYLTEGDHTIVPSAIVLTLNHAPSLILSHFLS